MKKAILFITAIIAFLIKAEAQSVEKQWVKDDSVFISNLAKSYKINPLTMEALLSYKGNRKEKLGFDYYSTSGSTGKGYVSIFYEFIYYKNQLISYKLDPQMPRDQRLTRLYLKFYAPLFKINAYQQPEFLYYGFEKMVKPLNGLSKPVKVDNGIEFLMTPYSGTMYGYYGGFGDDLLDNRRNYLSVKSRINPAICEQLLYSINPATRLCAAEFYYQNPRLFAGDKEKIEKRINIIFHELPQISTMSVDLEVNENAHDLVMLFVKKAK